MKKTKILLVDDEQGVTNIIKMCLEGTGKYEVRMENHAEHSLVAAREFKPDLILLDIVMPELPGSEVAYQIRSDAELKDVPIAFLTATMLKKEAGTMETVEGFPFIAKPVSGDELEACIEKLLAA